MEVLCAGVVDEYNADKQYNYTAHVEAQLEVLERLNPSDGAQIRARFEAVRGGRYVEGDHISNVAKAISARLDALAPEGLYFGIPRANSNIAGFWPIAWLKGGPSDAEARAVGRCRIGSRTV